MPLSIQAIDHLVLNVSDVDAAARWYRAVLGVEREDFAPGGGQPHRTALRFGRQKINLRPVGHDAADWSTGAKPTAGSADIYFLTTSPPADVVAHLAALNVVAETGPVTRQGALGPIRSVYCRDPDGNLVEIASYPT